MLLSLMMLSGSAMAQLPDGQESRAMRPKRVRMTQEQMTEKMVSDLKLDEKQTKKVTKLNKKFKTLIEGEQQDNMKGQRPPMGQGRPDGNRGGGRPGGGCTWNLTADTHITSFTGDASRIKANGHHLWVNGKEMNIQ